MRASSLSNHKLIERLNDDFVNTWIIIPQFKSPDKFFDDQASIDFAKAIDKEFTYPVDSIVLSSEGQPLSQGACTELVSFDNATAYLKMLDKASPQDDRP